MTRLKELEAENSRLKKMYAEERLKSDIIKDVLEKKLTRPSEWRLLAKQVVREHKNTLIADWLLLLNSTES